jgi:hemerythrin-like domain-containing protein
MHPASTAAAPDALAFLAAEHALLRRLLADIERQAGGDPRPVDARIDEACTALRLHGQIEEELFYPAVREALGPSPRAARALNGAGVAHAAIAELVDRLETPPSAASDRRAAVAHLAQTVRRHLAEEERTLFPLARRARLELAGLGQRMAARKVALAVALGVGSPGDTEEAEEAEASARASRGADGQ